MKTNVLILALPALCLACSIPETADSASDAAGTASPFLAKQPAGIHMVDPDANYMSPCSILNEEIVHNELNLSKEIEFTEAHAHNGCAFEWGGNKVALSFGGHSPYESVQTAEYMFDRMYQGKKADAIGPLPMTHEPTTEGTASDAPGLVKTGARGDSTVVEDSAAAMPLAAPAVSTSQYVAVPDMGDKAVWDPATNTLHVLYINHIVSVTVSTKDRAALRKEYAKNLAEVLLDKIHHNEYKRWW